MFDFALVFIFFSGVLKINNLTTVLLDYSVVSENKNKSQPLLDYVVSVKPSNMSFSWEFRSQNERIKTPTQQHTPTKSQIEWESLQEETLMFDVWFLIFCRKRKVWQDQQTNFSPKMTRGQTIVEWSSIELLILIVRPIWTMSRFPEIKRHCPEKECTINFLFRLRLKINFL
jgi:hypothetical protein